MYFKYHYTLVDAARNHNKFWEIRGPIKLPGREAFSVICAWGRIGTVGQWKTFVFSSAERAGKHMAKKRFEKERDGYQLKRQSQVFPSDERSKIATEVAYDPDKGPITTLPRPLPPSHSKDPFDPDDESMFKLD